MEKIKLLINEFFRAFHFDSSDLANQREDSAERDAEMVMAASRLLQVSEFRFFSIAHRQWYGSEMNDGPLEHVFSTYMFHDQVPCWVRHFARVILSNYAEGSLDPSLYNPRIFEPATPEMREAGIGYTILLAIIIVVFCIMISGYGTV